MVNDASVMVNHISSLIENGVRVIVEAIFVPFAAPLGELHI